MSCCKCCSDLIFEFEFELGNDIFISEKKDNILLPILPETDIDLLKDKIICEYLRIISELEQGKQPEIEFLLEEISAVNLENELDNREYIIQYYLNNEIWKENIL